MIEGRSLDEGSSIKGSRPRPGSRSTSLNLLARLCTNHQSRLIPGRAVACSTWDLLRNKMRPVGRKRARWARFNRGRMLTLSVVWGFGAADFTLERRQGAGYNLPELQFQQSARGRASSSLNAASGGRPTVMGNLSVIQTAWVVRRTSGEAGDTSIVACLLRLGRRLEAGARAPLSGLAETHPTGARP